ncbi:MAG: alpha/beta family hydrolase [Acidimicrobiia bacterium]
MTARRAAAAVAVLFPGAGTGADHPGLVAIEHALAPLAVARVDFAYRRAGRKAPPRAPTLVAEVREAASAAAEAQGVGPERVLLGGRSMGGRMCSMAVAEGLPAAGLVLVAYPLHPPGRPDKARTAHLGELAVPCLFVSGTRDAFGTPDELESATTAVPGPVTHVWVEGAGHDLARRDEEVAAAVATWVATLRAAPPRRRARPGPRG